MKLAPPDERSAEERAYDEGVEDAQIKAELADHSKHLAAINGSIDRTADGMKQLAGVVGDLRSDLKTRDKVAEALGEAVRDAATKTVSTKQFWLGVAGLAMVVLGALKL